MKIAVKNNDECIRLHDDFNAVAFQYCSEEWLVGVITLIRKSYRHKGVLHTIYINKERDLPKEAIKLMELEV